MKLRCKNCSKLLAIGTGNVQIKCTRCKELNHFNIQPPLAKPNVDKGYRPNDG